MFYWLLFLVPLLSIGVNIHYLSNHPSDFFTGLFQSFAWISGIAILLIVLLITGNLD